MLRPRHQKDARSAAIRLLLGLLAFSWISAAGPAAALDLAVTGSDGQPVTEFRWLIERDATYAVEPGVIDPHSLGVSFHRSYMPVVATGSAAELPLDLALDPGGHYYVSILPDSGYSNGGARFAGDAAQVEVVVNPLPIPTAQITVFAFEDTRPINNAPDLPGEQGLAGFTVVLEDAAGRYGAPGGQMMLDAFGNMLGTTYNPDGTVDVPGTGVIQTDQNGIAVIRNLPPGKFGVQVIPPDGEPWVQTTTIEGSRVIDAWVKANEPPYFREFGPPGWHVFAGFVQPMMDTAVLSGGISISGQVVNLRTDRPPATGFYPGQPFDHTTPWVGLNDLSVGIGQGVYAQRCAADGSFTIPDVPPGNYQLVVWDDYLDIIIAQKAVLVTARDGDIDLGPVPVFNWFSGLWNYVFHDENQNGFRDPGEMGLPEVGVNLRFRDGTIYQAFPTDVEGFAPFDEVFPFFHWLVVEVGFGRMKATGATFVVDAGGPADPAAPWSYGGRLNPQSQPDNNGQAYRTEIGPVLTQGYQGFLGQLNVIEWGKAAYAPGENGGISGMVFYATTRAENDPRLAAGEPWEPGIPRVQVALYADGDKDNEPCDNFPGPEDIDRDGDGVLDIPDRVIDDVDGDGGPTLTDVDNHPFGWRADPAAMGAEDVDRDGDGQFDLGDALQVVTTDSWDDALPTGCVGEPFLVHGEPTDCFDGLRNFNQMRPGVFDGGYAFEGVAPATYIVAASPPRATTGQPVYQTVAEEDRNVDFGDTFTPAQAIRGLFTPRLLPPPCVGEPHTVPDELSLFPGVATPMAGQTRPSCDRKQITLVAGANAAVDFFMFTQVPIAAHLVGFVLDDTANEWDPNSPQFGEKYAPPWMPVAIKDWRGHEISRVYTDEWGHYNALAPSTYTNNLGTPSGVSPSMLTLCINDPGPIPDPDHPGQTIIDPHYDPQYSQFCYTFQFMPGTTTYLDTPVVPVAAFAGPDQFPLDCELPGGIPRIRTVSGPYGGPYVKAAGQQLTIQAVGTEAVPNPAYDGPNGGQPETVMRDHGFGAEPGQVTLGGVPLHIARGDWSASSITATVPYGAGSGQLLVTRGDNNRISPVGITVTVGSRADDFAVHHVTAGESIQAAVDLAQPGDLILVEPGTYDEMVILWKPVRLQGAGAGSTVIRAIKAPAEALAQWRAKVDGLLTAGAFDVLPGQEQGASALQPEPHLLSTEEGAGVLVLAKDLPPVLGGYGLAADGLPNAWIDGFTISGADVGGGVVVNGYARELRIANNRIIGNQGFYGGGVRIGHPYLVDDDALQSAHNTGVIVHHNHISRNGGQGAAGGGVAIGTGADDYQVRENYICGNFSMGKGGGIGHLGVSDGGLIADNVIVFNEVFNQQVAATGGGVYIGGALPPGGSGMTAGSGSVVLDGNLILGNAAGSGDGGGVRVEGASGADVAAAPNRPRDWHLIGIYDNIIANNVAALAGGGISLQDVALSRIIHNTVVHNDSTATAGEAFSPGRPDRSNLQPAAGIISRGHSAALAGAIGASRQVEPYRDFSNPELANNIIWQNRVFYFEVDSTTEPNSYRLRPDVGAGERPIFRDLAVVGAPAAEQLDPRYSVLTSPARYHWSNRSGDPAFVHAYYNGERASAVLPEVTTIEAPPAFDEGGNFIRLRFGPLTQFDPDSGLRLGDYHIASHSSARSLGLPSWFLGWIPELAEDFDGQVRSTAGWWFFTQPDAGADEFQADRATLLLSRKE